MLVGCAEGRKGSYCSVGSSSGVVAAVACTAELVAWLAPAQVLASEQVTQICFLEFSTWRRVKGFYMNLNRKINNIV